MFSIRAEVGAGSVPTLYIMDAIGRSEMGGGGITISDVQSFLDQHRGAPVIRVSISSTGGDAWTGLAIYEALMRFPGEVHVFASGIVASAASIVFLAGSKRELAENTQLMIHQASMEVSGGESELQRAGRTLTQINRSMESIISQRTGQPVEIVRAWLAEEKWFDSRDAKSLGFATHVSDSVSATASLDLSRFKNLPLALKQQRDRNFAKAMAPKPKLSPEAMVKKYGPPKTLTDVVAIAHGRKA